MPETSDAKIFTRQEALTSAKEYETNLRTFCQRDRMSRRGPTSSRLNLNPMINLLDLRHRSSRGGGQELARGPPKGGQREFELAASIIQI